MFNINKKPFGKFWVENHEKEYFYGIIDFNTKDFRLEFDTNFKIPSDDEKVLINGVVENKPISFILINYPQNAKSYLIYDVCLGMHFDTKEDIKFEKIKFKINNISSVINFRSLGFNLSNTFPLKREPFEEFPPILMNDFTVKIELNNHENWKNRGNGQKITFEEDISIIIEYKKPQKIKTIHENITCIERLFTLLTGKSEITELKGIKEKTEINILSPYLLKENNNERKFAIRLNKNIEKVFKNWLTKYDEMDSVYNLFYSINESKEVNSITLFLTYSQILENYHRQRYNGEYLNKEEPILREIKKNINHIIKNIGIDNQNFKNKISSSTDYCYEYSFKDRLIEVFNELESYDVFNKILKKHAKNSNEPIEELAKIIKDNRNYYTHYGDKPERVFLPERKLHEINNSICKIIQLIFLKELGFEVEEINKYIDYPQFYLDNYYINLEY